MAKLTLILLLVGILAAGVVRAQELPAAYVVGALGLCIGLPAGLLVIAICIGGDKPYPWESDQ